MLTTVPAKILNLNKGMLEVGYDADFVVFGTDFTVTDVFVNGKKI